MTMQRVVLCATCGLTLSLTSFSPISFSHKILILDELRPEDPEPDKHQSDKHQSDAQPNKLQLSPTSSSHKILIFDELRSEDPEPDKQVWILFRGDSEPLPLDGLSFTQEMRLEQGWPYTYVKPPHTQKPDLKNVKSPQSL